MSIAIVKFTQLCSKFLPTALLNFACDWLALDRDASFGRLTNPCDIRSLTWSNHHKQNSSVLELEFGAKLGEFDYSIPIYGTHALMSHLNIMRDFPIIGLGSTTLSWTRAVSTSFVEWFPHFYVLHFPQYSTFMTNWLQPFKAIVSLQPILIFTYLF